MITDKEKQELIKEILMEAVPQIVSMVKEELAKDAGTDGAVQKEAINYSELVKEAMK